MNPAPVVREFTYQVRRRNIIGLAALFLFGAVVSTAKALTDSRGIAEDLLELSPFEATIFYRVLAAICVAMIIMSVWWAWVRATGPGRIVLGERSAIIPRYPFWRGTRSVDYASISCLTISKVWRQKLLVITYSQGSVRIGTSMLASEADFAEICRLLEERMLHSFNEAAD